MLCIFLHRTLIRAFEREMYIIPNAVFSIFSFGSCSQCAAMLCCCSRRTLIRSFEREMYVIPNAVFSKNTVLNVSRKSKEYRLHEYLCVRVQDVHKVNAIIQVCQLF
jgi:ribosomal protein S19